MLKSAPVTEDAVAALVDRGWGVTGAARFLPVGLDAQAWAYEIRTGDARYFAKLRARPPTPASALVPRHLYDGGLAAVVAPVPTSASAPWLALDGYALLLYPYVEGDTVWSGGLTDAQWVAHGGFLRTLHDTPLPDHLAALVPPEAYACEATRVRAVPRRVDGSPRHGDPARELAALWHTHRAALADLLDRAERLARAAKDRPGPAVLCHADLHGGNILVDAGGGLHVVDWDEAVRAPRERDLLFVLGGHFGEQPVTPHREALFRRGYGPVEVDPVRMAYYRHARVVDDLAEFAEGVLDGGADEASRLDDLGWLRRLLAPGGAVALALADPAG